MSKQHTLIALDWLMPVLQDVFDELAGFLSENDENKNWQAVQHSLHQVTGALTLTHHQLLAHLSRTLESICQAIEIGDLSNQHQIDVSQGIALLRYEIQQLQQNQQLHVSWLLERINYLKDILGESLLSPTDIDDHLVKADGQYSLFAQLPTPESEHDVNADGVQDLLKLWRYYTLQLLNSNQNQTEFLTNLAQVAQYLANSKLKTSYRQVWQLVATWANSQLLNDEPTPRDYAYLLNGLDIFMSDGAIGELPDLKVASLAVDVLLELSRLVHQVDEAQSYFQTPMVSTLQKGVELQTLFEKVLVKLEKTIYQVNEPNKILPILAHTKQLLENRGWVLYQNQLEQIIADVDMVVADPALWDSIGWQIERQLQDLYSQLLETSDTIESKIGLVNFSYAMNPKQEALRQTRINLENIKLAFNSYIQTHQIDVLQVNDDLLAMIQVFGLLELVQPKELTEQLRLLFNKLTKQSVTVLSWEITDAIAEMIAQFELFLDYLSHQNVNHDLLEQTQSQLNKVNMLIARLIDNPIEQKDLPSRHKVFDDNTLVYDDEGEKRFADVHLADVPSLSNDQEVVFDTMTHESVVDDLADDEIAELTDVVLETVLQETPALLEARESLKADDFSVDEDIREIFIEEADEVLQQMDENLPIWQADATDLMTLKEIRRGFHTLKGSGRMVGANQVGETAWAVENMLNRVLDGTLSITPELVQFIIETRQVIPTLVNDFNHKQSPNIDPAVVVLKAHNLLKQQPIDQGLEYIEKPVKKVTSPVENTEMVMDDVETLFSDEVGMDDVEVTGEVTLHASVEAVVTDSHSNTEIQLPDVVQQEIDQLNWSKDEVLDEDIQEIYIEEAQEVLETISPLYRLWQHHTHDEATLKEIRRGFHTLKGSGRMVGANQLGELAWAIENMLNRVLDHTIVVNDGLVTLVGDVLKVFPNLVQIFAENRDDYPEKMLLWAGVAHAYSKKQGENFDYQALRDWQPQPKTQIVADVIEEKADTLVDETVELEIVDDTMQVADLDAPVMDDELIQDDIPIDESIQSVDEETTADDTEQGVIGRAFIEESQELLAKIEYFVQSHRGDKEVYISDDLVRAFHTLRGGAALSELPKVYALSEALEDSLAQLLRKEIPLTAEQLELLSHAKEDLAQYIHDYQTHQSTVETSSDDGEIHALTKQLLGSVDLHDKRPITVSQLMALEIDDLLDADRDLPVEFAHEYEDIVDYATKLQIQAQRLAQETQGLKFASVAEVLDLAYSQLKVYPSFGKDEEYVNALLNVHYQLIDVFDSIAAGLNIRIDENILAQLKQVAEEKEFEAKMAAIEYEVVDTDVELLEIFLEEATALDTDIHKHFHQWYNNLTNLDAVKALQRYLHTIKGGANMVGINSISSLALCAEKLYAAIGKEQIPSTPELAMVMQKVQETITTQLQLVKLENRSFFAREFEVQLEEIQTIDDIDEIQLLRDMAWAVPLIVETYQNEQNTAESIIDSGSDEHINDAVYTQEIINNFEQRRLETWQGQEPDEDILSVFLEEAKELVDSSSQHLQEFRNNTNNISALQALQRELHTIKGGARMVGAEGLATLSHEMETVYEELGSRRKPATRMIGNLLAACHDWLASALYVLENKFNPQTPNSLILSLQEFSKNPDSLKSIPLTSLASQIEQIDVYKSSVLANQAEQKERDLSVMPAMTGNFEEVQEQANLNTEMVRIPANLMERMINLSGESAINRARIEMGVSGLINTIEEMGITVQRLADQLRRMETELEVQILAQIGDEHLYDAEFDPLEMDQYSSLNQLSKSLSESASDLLDIKATMLDKTRDTENLLLQLSRTQTELQEGLMNSRTVPFSRITPRLQRIARQTATELGKSVELRILNDDDEIDRNILDRITSPLEHMLRNAVDHGVERSQERIEAGKPRTGLITLELLREGGEIVLHLSDDGKGINVDAVRKKAIDQGLIAADDTSLKPLDIMQYIFNAGLSTSTSVTQISGRGVGMDVVQSEVKQLGGVVTVDSEMGKGSRFTMRLPLTVAVSDALMVRAGDKNFAVPLVQIERVVRVSAEDIYAFHTSEQNTLEIDGDEYRLRYLNQILYGSDPLESVRQQAASVPVIIIRNEAGQKLALQVDALAGSRIEVVVKPLGRQLSHISGISAATIMGDGSVMLILDLIALMRNVATVVKKERAVQATKADRKTVVLIIDDSVTVRKVTSRLLERHGYETHVATDGVDALEKLQEMTPDIMLLDIEMPRMDGFEVANQVRHTSRLKDVPIIMITSRTGEKHRERAMNIGVNEYMGKPFQEQQLLESIANLTAQRLT